ncbi:MAG TPA: ShlB/FhaC/HecB family hemolysin secretion/activation protein [Sphingomonas sp.]|nr:ShlB/FhaC/HecB family hemolysin secretion/activation protein [Sphingomonas sp.]
MASPALVTAQTILDRVDPSKIEVGVPKDEQRRGDTPVGTPPTTAPTIATARAPITVGAITLSGLERLHAADFADIFELYVGRTVSPDALRGLTDAIAARARSRGYVFAQASIAPQTMTAGVLRVIVDEGRVDEIRFRGSENDAVRGALLPLVGAGPVTLDQVERRLLIAGDVDGIWLRGTQFVREGDRNVLLVDVAADRVTAYLGLDNLGSRPIGPLQADLSIRVAQLLADDDLVTFSALTTPFEPNEFAYARLRYGKRIATGGTEMSLAASYSRARPGSYLASREIEGRSWNATLGVLHPLLRRREQSLWLEGSFGVRTVLQDRAERRARRDRLTVARLGAYGFTAAAGGRLRANLTISQGVDLFGATRRNDPFASRSDASGRFTTVAASADWTMTPIGGFSAQLGVATQIAAQPLLVSEETGLGGGSFLRGYNYSERIGDNGTMASAELRYTPAAKLGPLRKPQLYGFFDGGYVTNLDGGSGGGALFSTGAGLRAGVGQTMTADVALAVPLSGARYDNGNSDPIVSFRLTRRF